MGSRSWPRQQAADYDESRGGHSTAQQPPELAKYATGSLYPPPCCHGTGGLETHQAAGNSVQALRRSSSPPPLARTLPRILLVARPT